MRYSIFNIVLLFCIYIYIYKTVCCNVLELMLRIMQWQVASQSLIGNVEWNFSCQEIGR